MMGEPPLHLACSEGKLEIVKSLVDTCKIPINTKIDGLIHLLDDCIREGHSDIKDYLTNIIND